MYSMTEVFQTVLSSKGQVIIVKEIRKMLNLQKNQRFMEKVENGKVVLIPVRKLSEMGGSIKLKRKMSIEQIMKEVKEGWD